LRARACDRVCRSCVERAFVCAVRLYWVVLCSRAGGRLQICARSVRCSRRWVGFRSPAPTSRCNRLIEPDLDGSYTRKARLTNVSWKNSGVRRPARSAPDQGGASAQGLAEVASAKSVRAWSHLVRIQLFDLQSHEKRTTSRTDATNVASRYVRPKCSTRRDYHGSAALHPLRLALLQSDANQTRDARPSSPPHKAIPK
jgi:hypothetical protein